MQDNSSALLPSGLVDLLPPEAAAEAEAIHSLVGTFESFGYQRVKPPLAEFEECLFAPGPGQAVASETFRLMDPLSRKMMALRSDATPQITRIARSRLASEPRPLRLAYAVEVLRVKGTQLRSEREFLKVGCELIGSADMEADIEVAVLAISGLHRLGIRGLTIDLALPPLVGKIYGMYAVGAEDARAFDEALERRDRDFLKQHGAPAAVVLEALLEATGPMDRALERLAKIDLPEAVRGYVSALSTIADRVRRALGELGMDDVCVTVDPVERRGFDYHTGYAFALFSEKVRGELGRGGRYEFAGGGETATGFTLYMDTLRRVLPPVARREIRRVDASVSWAEIREMQESGAVVVREFGKENE
ncbi:MAG: ATP phosphoribosyltransferase regulatory subunit [Alphaproteobacteria bacterium]|nr:ATP phosphoribosyltransferase regulatory subunit [Alphaproteobacteria bacterium]